MPVAGSAVRPRFGRPLLPGAMEATAQSVRATERVLKSYLGGLRSAIPVIDHLGPVRITMQVAGPATMQRQRSTAYLLDASPGMRFPAAPIDSGEMMTGDCVRQAGQSRKPHSVALATASSWLRAPSLARIDRTWVRTVA